MELQLLPSKVGWQILFLIKGYLLFSRSGPRSLEERERALQTLGQALCGVLLRADAAADQAVLRAGPCACGGRRRSQGLRGRHLVTLVGEVRYRRRYYRCQQCGASFVPLDEAWGVESGCLSPLLTRLGVDLATALPFREGAWWLLRLLGIPVGLATLWRKTQEAGARLQAEVEAQEEAGRTRSGIAAFVAALKGRGSPLRWAVATDGVYVRIERQFREVKVAVFGPLSEKGEWLRGPVSYLASTVTAERFRLRVVRHGLLRGITQRTALVLVSDGAAWIEALARRHWYQAVVVRDWWHAVQYLWQGAQALYGEGHRKVAPLVEQLKEVLWKGHAEEVAEWLRKAEPPRLPQVRQASLHQACGYFDRQAAAMRYEEFREAHWPVGSGPAEAGCKTLVGSRMKRSGMNWSAPGAEHMLLLRADYCQRLHAAAHPQ